MTTAYIYALTCPDTGSIRYVGKAKDPEERLKRHIRDSKNGRLDFPVNRWVRELYDRGAIPGLLILYETVDWNRDERLAIAKARADGADLLNVAAGGNEPACSTEVRAMNGRLVAKIVHGDPARKRLWNLKRAIGSAIRAGLVSEGRMQMLRDLAERRPDLALGRIITATRAQARAREEGQL